MAERERVKKIKKGDKDQKHRNRQNEPEPSFDQSYARDKDIISINETPFVPQMKEHAQLLMRASSDEHRTKLIQLLHQTYGNRYVQRLVESMNVQAKLTISQPGDVYEQEADRVAEAVTETANSQVQRQEEEEELQMMPDLQRQEEEEELQMEEVSEDLEARINKARVSGQPVEETTRKTVERALGADFSSVRVHQDSEADALNQSLQSRAFTTGQDIFFKDGEYNPGSKPGLELLSHELIHTVQQGASKRIARWFPLGHRVITKKVFAESELNKIYDKDSQGYLEGRSPDMDFMQDEVSTMEAGRKRSSPKVETFKEKMAQLIKKSGGKGKKIDEAKLDPVEKETLNSLAKDFDDNELHKREQWYMLHHGEGGFYKQDVGSAVSINKAITDQMVTLAAAIYKGGQRTAGLSILSDALHQAEDRGSHEEGEEFKGHDIRKAKIEPALVPDKAAKKQKHTANYIKDYDPDDASQNTGGSSRAIKFAHDLLQSFKDKLELNEGEKITLSATGPQKRRATFKKFWTVFSTSPSVKFLGSTHSKQIKKLKPEQWNQLEEGVRELTPDEQTEVKSSMKEYVSAWLTSEIMERLHNDQGKALPDIWSLATCNEKAGEYYDMYLRLLPAFAQHIEGVDRGDLVAHIASTFKTQWKTQYHTD